MRKRMLSLLLCLCMAATLLTPTAWAADGHAERQEGDEASVTIGGTTTYYAELADAWTAATEGEAAAATITLLKDVTISQELCLSEAKEITFVGGAFTVTSSGRILDILTGTLNLESGCFEGEQEDLLVIGDLNRNLTPAVVNIKTGVKIQAKGEDGHGAELTKGTLNMTGGTIEGSLVGLGVTGSGTAKISGGKITATGEGSCALDAYGGTTTISGTAEIKGNTGIEIRATRIGGPGGTVLGSGSVIINGGTVEGTYCGVFVAEGELTVNNGVITSPGAGEIFGSGVQVQGGTATVTGGKIQAGTGVHVMGGTLNVSGGTIEGTGEYSTGMAIYTSHRDTHGSATISGGEITGEACGLDYSDAAASLTLTGGTFHGTGEYAVSIVLPESGKTLRDILGKDKTYAYFRDNVQIYDSELDGDTLTGVITVKEGLATNPGPAPSEHTHTPGTAWRTDETHHWHVCTECAEVTGSGAHVYDNDADTTCNTCGYIRTVSGGDAPVAPPAPSYPVIPPYTGDAAGSTSAANPSGNKPGEDKAEGTSAPTTVTDPQTGAVTETTANPDGSSVAVITRPDGTLATVTTASSGQVSAAVTLPAAAVSAAQNSGEAVVLPIPEVRASRSTAAAPSVTVSTGSSQPVKVEIPTAAPTPGTVAVLVKADGTEEIIRTSVPTADGVAVTLSNGDTVKIVDNSKDFADVTTQHWAGDAVDFVTARELFSGTSETAFTPEAPMTRAMLVTVLARLDGADTTGGATWYEKGVEWAIAHDVSDGSNPNGNITREQLAVMLWRYAGSPSAGTLSGYAGADEISDYAKEAMCWAVNSGIINGLGNGQLAPQEQATRAQVAQMLMNFMEK